MLSAREVRKDFGSFTALDSVSLTVRAGQAVCLLGANGAGKTTLLNLFLGFSCPDRGEVRVRGSDPFREAKRLRPALAYIPENVSLYDAMSGLENLEFFDRLAGNRHTRADLLSILDEVGLAPARARQPVRTYSKGMRQKVGLAIAQAKDAAILVLDEPLSGLDPSAAREFVARIHRFREEGRTILMATHDIFRAVECASSIGIMRAGRLVEEIDTQRMHAPDIERVYLDHMTRTERGEVAHA